MIPKEQIEKIRQGDKGELIDAFSELLEELGSEPEEETFKRGRKSGLDDVVVLTVPKLLKHIIENKFKIDWDNYDSLLDELQTLVKASYQDEIG